MVEPEEGLVWLRAANAIHAAASEDEILARLKGAAMALTSARQVFVDPAPATDFDVTGLSDPAKEIAEPLVDGDGRYHGRLVARSDRDGRFAAGEGAVLRGLADAAAASLSRIRPASAGDGPPIDTLNDLAQRLAQVGGWSVDVQRRRAYWTDQKAAIHGLPHGTWLDLEDAVGAFAPEFRAIVAEAYDRCATDGEPYDLEAELLTPAGERRWVRTIGVAERDGSGRIVRVNGAFQDISRVRDAEDRFRYVTRATIDTIWDWNLKTDRLWWGDGGEALFGRACDDEWEDISVWSERIHPDDRVRILESMQYALNSRRESWRGEYRFLKPDGSHALIADRAFIIVDHDGRPFRMVGGMSDVTERQALEARLNQAQRLEAIGHLTGGIAHDFNNLLTVILGNAEALVEGLPEGDGRLRRLAAMVQEAAERGSAQTRRLLAVARRQPLQPRPVSLGTLLADMGSLMRQALGDGIDLQISQAPGTWDALVDAPQLEAAVLNLCLNARDAMGRTGALGIAVSNVEVGAEEAAAEDDVVAGGYVLLEVRDTGVGMTAEVMSRAFEPFFTTKELGRGSGLGLSTVYGFVRQSGGTVRLVSEPGKGTSVRLYLPPSEVAVPESGTPPGSGLPGGTEKILLVEDDDLVRDHVAAQLVRLGYRVVVASRGAEGLDRLKEEADIDLLFTDIRMPGGMDGSQMAAQALQHRPDLKVLFTSGYTDDAVMQEGMNLLAKPYRRSELALQLRRVLDSSGSEI